MKLWIEIHCDNVKCEEANYTHEYPMTAVRTIPTKTYLYKLAREAGWLKKGTKLYCCKDCMDNDFG